MEMDDLLEHEENPSEGADFTPSAMSSLTGFLFGNIDEKGELQEDFLDEVLITSFKKELCQKKKN